MTYDLIYNKIRSHDRQGFQNYLSNQAKFYNLQIVWSDQFFDGSNGHLDIRDDNGDLKSIEEMFQFILKQQTRANCIKMYILFDPLGSPCGGRIPREWLYFSFVTMMEMD